MAGIEKQCFSSEFSPTELFVHQRAEKHGGILVAVGMLKSCYDPWTFILTELNSRVAEKKGSDKRKQSLCAYGLLHLAAELNRCLGGAKGKCKKLKTENEQLVEEKDQLERNISHGSKSGNSGECESRIEDLECQVRDVWAQLVVCRQHCPDSAPQITAAMGDMPKADLYPDLTDYQRMDVMESKGLLEPFPQAPVVTQYHRMQGQWVPYRQTYSILNPEQLATIAKEVGTPPRASDANELFTFIYNLELARLQNSLQEDDLIKVIQRLMQPSQGTRFQVLLNLYRARHQGINPGPSRICGLVWEALAAAPPTLMDLGSIKRAKGESPTHLGE
nr:PREDICTED: uncharacterized protein LOC106704571 [Latimeria chalumnae]|eukprot:XP_014347350.1 PREDICTED: uncharacterized protein LOC106704571 [Latimeria chalumnae]